MKKNTIIIIFLSLLVVLLGGYIVYEKTSSKDLEPEKEESTQEEPIENSQEDWIDYLLNQDIQKITLKYCPDKNDAQSRQTYNLTKDELNQIFTPLKQDKLIKHWKGGMGGYGCACCDLIQVDYKTEKGEYNFKYNNNEIKSGIVVRNKNDKTNNNNIADVDLLEVMESNHINDFVKDDPSIEENIQIRWLYKSNIFDLNNDNPIHEIVKNKN